MPRSSGQVRKMPELLRILWQESDERHTLTVQDIIAKLHDKGVDVERKTVYNDLQVLSDAGFDIICVRDSCNRYYWGDRILSLPELKMLADAVASSVFLSESKSEAMIGRLSALVSRYDAGLLRREIYVGHRAKGDNEHILYSVDSIQTAIQEKKQVGFRYFNYGVTDTEKGIRRVFRDDGAVRFASPKMLVWDNGKYYMPAYYEKYGKIVNFRVDRMEDVFVSDRSVGTDEPNPDPSQLFTEMFAMYPGEEVRARFSVEKNMIHAFYDRFGDAMTVLSSDESDYIEITALVEISPPFIGWLFQFAGRVKILSPDKLVKEVRQYALKML